MARKRVNLFLYLTLACFLGLIVIFVVDGYLGIYDTVNIISGERDETINPENWLRQDRSPPTGVSRGEKAFFRYEVDNRRFSAYTADIEVSVWHGQEKVRDLISQPMSIAAFDKEEWEWVLDTTELLPGDIPPEQGYEFSVIIKRGETELKVIVDVRPLPYAPKSVPVPTR